MQEKILIVEDESIVALDIKGHFENAGYKVVGIASTGEEAVKQAHSTKPDLILMDINLKGGSDGISIAKEIQSQQDVAVAFLTAYSNQETVQRAKEVGPYAYLLKPFQEKELLVMTELALYLHRLEMEKTTLISDLEAFAHVVSHDLKAPLRGIGTLVDDLEEKHGKNLDEDSREGLKLINQRITMMHQMIDSILQYSRASRGDEKKETTPVAKLIKNIETLLSPPKGIEIDVSDALPTVDVNPTLLQEVFQNLISNAIRYMGKPQGRIAVGCEDIEDSWIFSVADTGPGIDPEYHKKIFQLFFRKAQPGAETGSGIGLAIVKRIVDRLQGQVWVDSKPGRGSTFFFTLPKATLSSEKKHPVTNGRHP